jgi:hypothetical protein
VKVLPNSIDTNKPPCNYQDAVFQEKQQEWAAAYMEEVKVSMMKGHYKSLDPSKVQRFSIPQPKWITR